MPPTQSQRRKTSLDISFTTISNIGIQIAGGGKPNDSNLTTDLERNRKSVINFETCRVAWPLHVLATAGVLLLAGYGGSYGLAPVVKTHLGTSQPCHQCLKKIEPVRAEHLVTLGGSQYVVCDKTCAEALKRSLEEQGILVQPPASK